MASDPMASFQFFAQSKRPSGTHRRLGAALLGSLVLMMPLTAQAYPARGGFGGGERFGGGGGERFGGGGERFGGGDRVGGGYHFGGAGQGGSNWRSGYQGDHPMFGPGARPGWGGSGTLRPDGNGFNRNTFNNQNVDDRLRLNNQGGINVNNYNRTTINRNLGDNSNFYNRDYNGWTNNWRNGGYWNDRPWGTGWFNGGASSWGWWGANAVGWGLAGLATGAVIGGLVNAASEQASPVFLVPQTSYQLNYGSVESVGTYGVSFNYLVNGTQLLGAANCQQGLLNGQIPSNGDQAQLLNAVCQVAYGTGL